MRSISYSPNPLRAHTRRNTLNTMTAPAGYVPAGYTSTGDTPTLSKKNDVYSQSVPNVLPIIKPPMTAMRTLTTASEQSSITSSAMTAPNTRLMNNISIDTNATTDIEEELSQNSNSSFIVHHKYTDSVESNKSNKNKPNVHILSMRGSINITVPEDAVLTPDRDHGMKSLDIKIKEPQNNVVAEDVIVEVMSAENIESNLDMNSNNDDNGQTQTAKNEITKNLNVVDINSDPEDSADRIGDGSNSDEASTESNPLKDAMLIQPNSVSVHSNASLHSNESEAALPDQNNLRLDKMQIYSQSRSSAVSITSDNGRGK